MKKLVILVILCLGLVGATSAQAETSKEILLTRINGLSQVDPSDGRSYDYWVEVVGKKTSHKADPEIINDGGYRIRLSSLNKWIRNAESKKPDYKVTKVRLTDQWQE